MVLFLYVSSILFLSHTHTKHTQNTHKTHTKHTHTLTHTHHIALHCFKWIQWYWYCGLRHPDRPHCSGGEPGKSNGAEGHYTRPVTLCSSVRVSRVVVSRVVVLVSRVPRLLREENKSDISYLKTSQALDIPIQSRALLVPFSVG